MNRHSNFGYASILLSFIIICIITFTALTLLTANSDYKLSKKVADRNTAYYEACEQAYETIASVDKILFQSFTASANEGDYYSLASTQITGTIEDITWNSEEKTISFSVPIVSNQVLECSLLLHYPDHDYDSFYSITNWQSVHIDAPFEEQPLNLIGSGN